MKTDDPNIIRGCENIRAFLLAGKATFTLKNSETKKRFTFKVRRANYEDLSSPFFVSAMTGTDNEKSFRFIGTIFLSPNLIFKYSAKSKLARDEQVVKVFDWFFVKLILTKSIPDIVEFWHSGRCGCCGRKLTVTRSNSYGSWPSLFRSKL